MIRFFLTLLTAVMVSFPAAAAVDIKEVRSPGGLTAWLVEDQSIPFAALEIRFRGGASLDAEGKRGAIALMSYMLDEGAGALDARAFARASESLATSFGFDISDDELSVSARFLTENRDASMELLRSALLEPRFDADAIERVRAQVLSGIRSDAKDPNAIAGRTMDQIIWGDHPYATALEGTEESVSALTRDDLVAAHRAIFARDRIYIGAVGDISEEELAGLIDELLGDLPETGAPMPPRAEIDIPGGVTVVPFETPQSVAIFGQAGISQDDPDYFTAAVLNHVIGGGSFESRLMTEVREKRGLTYGVYSYLAPKDLGEVYMGSVSSANDRIAEAIDVIRAEWRRAAEEGVTPSELADAKTYLTGAYPLRFDGNARIARIIVGMQMLGLPIDYVATRNDKVEAVTMDDIRRVAADLLDPDGLHFVVVGQPEGVESTAGN
ncbi:pitrilysin family protein [uncultured Roseobacter sp.]|uniref:M16 family metallopeptidase n=1 Tax=uncultured Roseobacter sp. TaxID=114847 RepID=UPI002607D45E|nr:pitrilysin family protein [uncultured Roseobacter sp.]